MPSDKVKCFSYVRWSSEKQTKGTSLERQLAKTKEFAKKNNFELIELVDSGISAYKGNNIKKGALGSFIQAVKDNVIPKGSWLVVENLDRLSRQTPLTALSMFGEILELGINIHTATDNKTYSYKSMESNSMDLLSSIFTFIRANDESKIKSDKTYGHAKALIARHNNGERAPDGNPWAIKSIGTNIWWSDCSNVGVEGQKLYSVKTHDVYYPIAKKMLELGLQGYGIHSVTKYLNEHYLDDAPITTAQTKNGKPKGWHKSRVKNFFESTSLFGEKEIKVQGVNHIIKGYYPALCDEDTYYKLQAIRKANTSKQSSVKYSHMLTGHKILKCAHCGDNMYAHTSKKTTMRLGCANSRVDSQCRTWTFNTTWLEDTLLRLCANHIFRPQKSVDNLLVVERGLVEKQSQRRVEQHNLIKALKSGAPAEVINPEITALNNEIQLLTKQIESVKLRRQQENHETVEWGEVNPRVLDINEFNLREKISAKIGLTVKEISCFQVAERFIRFDITFINGVTLRAYRTPTTLAFDGQAWLAMGDFYGQKVTIDNVIPFPEPSAEYIEREERELNELREEVKADGEGDCFIEPPPNNVGEIDGYKYNGLYGLSSEMAIDYENGKSPKQLESDILRAQHLATWADGMQGVPKIIEDQYQVYKHNYKKYLVKKPKPAIYHIDGVDFPTHKKVVWQK